MEAPVDLSTFDLFLAGAFVCALLAAFEVTTRVHLGWVSLAVFFLGLFVR